MNSTTIARNSLWYSIETGTNFILTFATSIAVARYIGPTKLGYFLYVWWAVQVATTVGSLGIPSATRKYMSEFYGRKDLGVVRAVFFRTLQLQLGLALLIATVGLTLVAWRGEPEYRAVSFFMVGSILPYMVNSIAAQANMAFEDLSANVPASLVSTFVFVAGVGLSLWFGWGLLGISVGLLTMRSAEVVVRLAPCIGRIRKLPRAPLPDAIRRRMFVFSGKSMVLLILGLVVWDRSELFFLKNFCADIRQVAFYSVAFNITERLLVIPQVFGQAAGTTVMVQFGRDKSRLPALVAASARYLGLIAFPVHLGLAAMAGSVMFLIYGSQYGPAVPALTIAAILGISKAFFLPAQNLLESTENQSAIIRWGLISTALNISLDLLLIPKFGAIGAAIANGTTQTFSVIALWSVAWRLFEVRLPVKLLAKFALIAVLMALGVHLLVRPLPALAAAIVGPAFGAVFYVVMLRLTRSLGAADHYRLQQLRTHLPARVRGVFEAAINWLIPAGAIDDAVVEAPR
jgi:O-antigen/teichoic acid export membrane protein